jgi:hypothetical protein
VAQRGSAQAREQLALAQSELDAEIRQAATRLAEQQMMGLEQLITAVLHQQQTLLAETVRLDELQRQGKLTIAQRHSLAEEASQQRFLADEAEGLAERASQLAAFELALRSAAESMHRAVERLDRFDAGATTQGHQRDALVQLQQIATAVKGDAGVGKEIANSTPPGPSEVRQDDAESAATHRRLAELRLVKLMQEAINRTTLEIEQTRLHTGRVSAEQQPQLERLARQQGALAEIVFGLSQHAEAAAPNVGEELPVENSPADTNPLDKALDEMLKPRL